MCLSYIILLLVPRPYPRFGVRFEGKDQGRDEDECFAGSNPYAMLFLIDFGRIEDAFSNRFRRTCRRIDLGKETASISFVACGAADLIDLCQQRIRVAVVEDFLQLLNIPAFFALSPQLLPASAVVTNAASLKCFLISRFVHVSEHQDVPGFAILSDHGN